LQKSGIVNNAEGQNFQFEKALHLNYVTRY
jgi:hypothetical protein